MKKILFAIAALLALALTSCKEKEKGIEGTSWRYRLEASSTNWMQLTFSFAKAGKVTLLSEYRLDDEFDSESVTGTYTYVDNTVRISIKSDDDDLVVVGTINGNVMILHEQGESGIGGLSFLKQ